MNYAFMSFSCPDLSIEAMLSLADRLGYAAIEPRSVSGHAHGVEPDTDAEQRDMIRQSVSASHVKICAIATSCRYADPATVSENVAETHRFIDLAGDIDVPLLRVFGGKLGEYVDREGAVTAVAESMQEVSGHAAERGVTLCLETHDDWCDPSDVVAVMSRVNHPNIAVNWDILHPVRTAGYTTDAAYDLLKPWIRHVHFHDSRNDEGNLIMVPVGHGMCDHRRAVELLLEHGYDGYLSGEWINWEPYEVHLPRELATMRGYESELANAESSPQVPSASPSSNGTE